MLAYYAGLDPAAERAVALTERRDPNALDTLSAAHAAAWTALLRQAQPQGITFSINGKLSAAGGAPSAEDLDAFLSAYREKLGPELTEAFMVLIVGNTDSTGDEGHNMRLSLA